MKVSKSPRHLGQSISMGVLLVLVTVSVIAFMTMQSGALG